MVVIDSHLARGASNGGCTFHDRGGPYGRTEGVRRVVAVDGPARPWVHSPCRPPPRERASELMLEHLAGQAVAERLEIILVNPPLLPQAQPPAPWKSACGIGRQAAGVPAHPARLARRGRPRPPRPRPTLGDVVFENTTNPATGWLQTAIACIATTLRHLSRAKPAGSLASCGRSVGTPGYAPPKRQSQGRRVHP